MVEISFKGRKKIMNRISYVREREREELRNKMTKKMTEKDRILMSKKTSTKR